MIRSPRYPSTGDTIHADPLAMISPEGRTFSIFQTDDIEMRGLVSSSRNGLLFYDNDREQFLHRPVFADLLADLRTPTLTPLQVGVLNEFNKIRTWKDFGRFLLKLDKTLILDQFRQYLGPENPSPEIFYLRAKDFCERESIHLTEEELYSPDALRRLTHAIGSLETMKSSFFVSAVPDVHLPHPDPALCQAQMQKRASRWYNVAGKEDQLPEGIKKKLAILDRETAVRQIVEKYMSEVDKWEGSPLMKSADNCPLSRADLEDFLNGSSTVYCPSPLGWTPRLRYAFYCPEKFKHEDIDVKIEVIAALEKRISEEARLDVRMVYIQDSNCLVLESISEPAGGGEIPCTFENGAQSEVEVINLGSENLRCLSRTVMAAKNSMGPEMLDAEIQNARIAIAEMKMSQGAYEEERMDIWETVDTREHAETGERMEM